MISGGFVPNPLHEVNEYIPTPMEGMITLGVYALSFFVLTILIQDRGVCQRRSASIKGLTSFYIKKTKRGSQNTGNPSSLFSGEGNRFVGVRAERVLLDRYECVFYNSY